MWNCQEVGTTALRRKAANAALIVATDHIIASRVQKPRDFYGHLTVVVHFKVIACGGDAVAAEAQQRGQHMTCCCKCKVQRPEGRAGR